LDFLLDTEQLGAYVGDLGRWHDATGPESMPGRCGLSDRAVEDIEDLRDLLAGFIHDRMRICELYQRGDGYGGDGRFLPVTSLRLALTPVSYDQTLLLEGKEQYLSRERIQDIGDSGSKDCVFKAILNLLSRERATTVKNWLPDQPLTVADPYSELDPHEADTVQQPALNTVQALRAYVGLDHGRGVTLAELEQIEDRLRWRQSRNGKVHRIGIRLWDRHLYLRRLPDADHCRMHCEKHIDDGSEIINNPFLQRGKSVRYY
jgi:hypothetical protein